MRRQLIVAALALTSMIVLAFVVPLAVLVRTLAEDRALTNAEHRAQVLVLATFVSEEHVEDAIEEVKAQDPSPASVVLPDGRVLGDPAPLDADLQLARTGRAFNSTVPGGVAVFVPVQNGTQVSVVRVFVPDDVRRRGVYFAWLLLGGLGLTMILIATAVADRIGKSIVDPVRALADTADRLGQGELEARVEPSGPPEIEHVGQTLNRLAGRIHELLTEEREAVADLSHRLRTPITAMRLDVDALPESDERERLVVDVDALTRSVDRLITEARRPVRIGVRATCDLADATRDRVAFWMVLAEEQNRPCHLDAPDRPCRIGVTRDDLDAALDALLGNVFAHTAAGVAFRVTVTPHDVDAGGAGGAARLVVEDDGGGWPDRDVLPRGESAGGSTGLGLDIVRRTAIASGGSIELDAAPSGGARVTVDFGPPKG
jgi:signal transduction histidine kinase